MTWGTPTYTNTYGNYTLAVAKAGYEVSTTARDFTDGLDWGTAAAPVAITLKAVAGYGLAKFRFDGEVFT